MARLPRTSAASYATFKNLAWNQLSALGNAGLNVRGRRRLLYNNCYTPTLDPLLPPKAPLTSYTLCYAMRDICNAAGAGRNVRNQGQAGWPILNTANLATEYTNWGNYYWWQPISYYSCGLIANPQPVAALSATAQSAMGAYLHIYATGGRVENNNWRIAFNIQPGAIPAAVAAMCTVLDNNADIGHFKISAPGTVGKPDSLIVYMNRNAGTYAGIRVAVINAVGALAMQPTFAPLWNEFALGEAEGAEPPRVTWNAGRSGFSFGSYRCLLTAMAYENALNVHGGGLTQLLFDAEVDTYFARYGIPVATPHDQYQIVVGAAPLVPALRTAYITNAERDELLQAAAINNNLAANYYTTRAGGIGNRAVIT